MTDLLFNIQPQVDGFYCVWTAAAGAEDAIEYRNLGEDSWHVYRPRRPDRAFVRVSRSGDYALRLQRRSAGASSAVTSREVRCSTRSLAVLSRLLPARTIPYERFKRFHQHVEFARYAARLPVTTLAGTHVDAADPEIGNGFYRVAGRVVLLSRAVSNQLETHPTAAPDLVRSVAMRLLFGSTSWQARAAVLADQSATFEPVRPPSDVPYAATGHITATRFGGHSRIVHCVPSAARPRGCAIYLEGHTGAALQIGWPIVHWLLGSGWEVFCLDMPLCGLNSVDKSNGLASHNDLLFRDGGEDVHPIGGMIEPIRWVVDRIMERDQATRPVLIGRSGGGLLAYLYAAIDERIAAAVSIAGGVPLSQRLEHRAADLGDYEQFAPSFYDLVRHEDLMLAAAARRLLLIFNRHDPDCFSLRSDHPLCAYLQQEAQYHGCHLQTFIDPDHAAHSLGPAGYEVLRRFLRDLTASKAEGTPTLQ